MGTVASSTSNISNLIIFSNFKFTISNMSKLLMVCLAVVLFAAVAMAAPFNAKPLPDAWFYNGDVARAPNFASEEAGPAWKGLVKKQFTLGGRETYTLIKNKKPITGTIKLK